MANLDLDDIMTTDEGIEAGDFADDAGLTAEQTSDADLVVLEYMPAQHVSSHRAARNWGRYPGNGAIRVLIDRETAEEIVEGDKDEYARVIREATAKDMGDLDRVDYPADL